jgi:hypothetical protein
MNTLARRTVFGHSPVPAILVLALAIAGCTRQQSADQALAKAYEATGGSRQEVAKFAGTVTIDQQTPTTSGPSQTLVILYDPRHPDTSKKAPIYTTCDAEGHFQFTTYGQGDGVPPGTYVVLFAQLRMNTWGQMGYSQPDELKNEYNDPDKNQKDPEFKVEVTAPGRTDYHFDLKVAGKDLAGVPGPNAITAIH